MTRRQLLFRTSATWLAGLGSVSPLAILHAAPLSGAAQIRIGPNDGLLTEFGGLVRGAYQLRTVSVAHHVVI